MQLTGVATRAVGYSYYSAALADGAEYVITQNGEFSMIGGNGGSSCSIKLSGNGTNWFAGVAGPAYPVCHAGAANKLAVRNFSGGAVVLHVSGVYFT